MNVIASRIAEIDLTVLDDRVRPIGDVKRAIRTKLDVYGSKMNAASAQYIRHLLRDVV